MVEPNESPVRRARRRFAAFLGAEAGAAAIGYVMIASFIFLAIYASIGTTGMNLGGRWSNIANNAAANMRLY